MPLRHISASTSLDTLKKEAKRWLKALRDADPAASARFKAAWPGGSKHRVLRDVQHALAREHGFDGWRALKQAVEAAAGARPATPRLRRVKEYESVAADFVAAFDKRDAAALKRLNDHYHRSFTFDDLFADIWRRNYAFRHRSSRVPKNYLPLEEARLLVAQGVGFGSWTALLDAVANNQPPVPAFAVDDAESKTALRRLLVDNEWDALVPEMKERRVTSVEANGMITDDALARIAELDHVTSLSLGGSPRLSDDGLLQLARMPQLRRLDLNGYPGGNLTDRGLEVLRYLPNLREFEMAWQKGIGDAGAANLRFCDQLESVNLMGSPTGDGAILALQGKPNLRRFSSGKLVTDAGLLVLQNFPRLKTWHGPPLPAEDAEAEEVKGGASLLIDGPFTNAGLASLAGLEGVFDLDLFWHVTGITSDGMAHLVALPNLASLGADGKLSDDVAMGHFAAMPRLRRIRIQESAATEAGFEALAQSRTLSHVWGRESPNFASRSFVAFSKMPALRTLGINCSKVDDAALATLPDFPALRELTPIGFQDAGFAHVGKCTRLQRLTCMYCRDTTDAATEQITNLRIKYYYAGCNKITDRSLQILGNVESLEQVAFYECNGITDAGLPHLAALPRLRGVEFCGSPGVTLAGTQVFNAGVRVKYWT